MESYNQIKLECMDICYGCVIQRHAVYYFVQHTITLH